MHERRAFGNLVISLNEFGLLKFPFGELRIVALELALPHVGQRSTQDLALDDRSLVDASILGEGARGVREAPSSSMQSVPAAQCRQDA